MQIFSTVAEITNYRKKLNTKVAIVPTMGGLHQGHLSLIKIAQKNADIIIVSIFVNPTQFSINEDFNNYPRDIEADINTLKENKVDALFIPSNKEVYPADFVFNYKVGNLANILCGKSRPGHFQGVCQVVFRLFDIIKPDIAVFGKKDYQQLSIINQMVKDLNLDVEIIAGDIVRDEYGLALSTRNKYLNENELNNARRLNKIISSNNQNLDIITKQLKQYFEIDYCSILDAKNLGKITNKSQIFIILVAIKIGSTRLIDNFIFTK